MAVKLVANGCADEVGSIRIEPLLDEEIDMTKVYEPRLMVIFSLSPVLGRSSRTLLAIVSIHIPSSRMVYDAV